jgi:predicted amidohydrolase YtcJ
MGHQHFADLLLVNARVITLVAEQPAADAIAVCNGRIQAIGSATDLATSRGPATEVVDVGGALALPAFHDAHCHLLSYARARARADCRTARSLSAIAALLRTWADLHPGPTEWVRGIGYDETQLVEGRHPDRYDLDAAVSDRPVRLQHRSLHADVLNTRALRLTGLYDETHPSIECDPESGEPTGRLFHAGELLRGRLPHGSEEELTRDVRAASERLLSWGVASVQDATVTNGPEELGLFRRLVGHGALPFRLTVFRGARHWRDLPQEDEVDASIRLGPVKFLLDERTADPHELRTSVAEANAGGHAVAIHAVSEAEVAIALEALHGLPPPRNRGPNRIEHGSVIPDGYLDDLRGAHVTVVGQPTLVYERGDIYRSTFPDDVHAWLHRAASLLGAGVPYAIGSDAPVGSACPLVAFAAATTRQTAGGATLAPAEALSPTQALTSLTHAPARAIGLGTELGRLLPGTLADIVVLDRAILEGPPGDMEDRTVDMTLIGGKIVWRRVE